jgi:hypothetical protein
MTDKAISPLRRRLIEDMTIRRLSRNTQHQYIRHVKSFADFVGRSLENPPFLGPPKCRVNAPCRSAWCSLTPPRPSSLDAR